MSLKMYQPDGDGEDSTALSIIRCIQSEGTSFAYFVA